MELLINVAISLVMGILTAYFASKRGRNTTAWFFIGVLLGIFGILILFLIPRVDSPIVGTAGVTPVNKQEPVLQEAEIEVLEWFYLDAKHREFGPVSEQKLKSLFSEGVIDFNSFVWKKGMEGWKKIEEVPSLKAIVIQG